MREGWKKELLKNACKVFTDGNWIESKDQSSEGIRLVQTGNIGCGYFRNKDDKSRFISEETFVRLKCTEILPGDLLVSRLPDPVGKSCIIPDLNTKMITGVDCTIIRPKDYLTSEYLGYFQMSNEYLKDVQSRVSGTTRSRISRKNLGLIEIPIPPLPEQKQIVALLDQAFAAIDQAKANIEKNIENAKELFQSKLNAIFSQKGDGWEEKTLGALADFKNGLNFRKSSNGELIKLVGVANFKNRFYVPTSELEDIQIEGNLSTLYELKNDDLLTVRSNGNPNLIGRCMVAKGIEEKTSHSGFTIRIRPNSDLISPTYLCHFLKSSIARNELINSGTGINIRSLNQGALSRLGIHYPASIKVQEKLSTQIIETEKILNKLEMQYWLKVKSIEELKKSILQKAFAGELTNKSTVGSNQLAVKIE